MKKLLLLVVLIVMRLAANADGVEKDGIYYNLVKKAKQAEVTKNPNKYSGTIIIPEKVYYEGVDYDVVKISDEAFSSCVALISVTIPNSVTSIGESSFSGCNNLQTITIGNNVSSIGKYAFRSCSNLTSLTIPNSVTSIEYDAFRFCSSLTSLIIPGSVSYIGYNAFADCKGLNSVIISDPIKKIPQGAFSGCENLTTITIPPSLTSIESEALRFCKKLNKIQIANLEAWCKINFDGSMWGNEPFDDGFHLYLGEEEIKDLIIPNSVTNINNCAFMRCSGLTSVKIPNSVTSIGNGAFQNCNSITQVVIGNGIKTIGGNSFAQCPELKDVYCLAEEITSSYSWEQTALYTSSNAFDGSYIEFATLHVPEPTINTYQTTTPWNGFGEYKTLTGETVETPKCATPTISFDDGKIKFSCETEGVKFVSNISTVDANDYYDAELSLSYKYIVTVYATKNGYENSETVTAEFTANGKFGDLNGDGIINVADHVKLSDIIMNINQ